MAVEGARQETLAAARNAALILLLAGTATACASTGRGLPLAEPSSPRISQAAPPSSGRLRGTDKPYQVNGQWYFPHADPSYDEVGTASWYGYPFQNRHTANGEIYDEALITAAHKTLPLPCIVEVTNLKNGRSIRVRVNDRGPFVGGRLIDLSKAAAARLGFDRSGLTRVRVRFIAMATPLTAPGLMMASNTQRPSSAAVPDYASPRSGDVASDDIEAPPAPIETAYDQPQSAPPAAYRPVQSPPADDMAEDQSGPPAPAGAAPMITTQSLPPIEASPRSYGADRPAPSGGGYSVQAGAFATQSSADRAVARLASAGGAQIVPLQRNGATLYRVVVGAFPDATSAGETRARVVAMGFADARVIGGY